MTLPSVEAEEVGKIVHVILDNSVTHSIPR